MVKAREEIKSTVMVNTSEGETMAATGGLKRGGGTLVHFEIGRDAVRCIYLL